VCCLWYRAGTAKRFADYGSHVVTAERVALILARVVPDGKSLEPRFCCQRLDMAETIRKRRCSLFYLPKDTFDSILISMWKHLKSIATFIDNIH